MLSDKKHAQIEERLRIVDKNKNRKHIFTNKFPCAPFVFLFNRNNSYDRKKNWNAKNINVGVHESQYNLYTGTRVVHM